jgi:hypothetical protein
MYELPSQNRVPQHMAGMAASLFRSIPRLINQAGPFTGRIQEVLVHQMSAFSYIPPVLYGLLEDIGESPHGCRSL